MRCASHQALAYYRQLYELERHGQGLQRRASVCRCARTWPCRSWTQFHTWLEAQRPEVLPKSPMARGDRLRAE